MLMILGVWSKPLVIYIPNILSLSDCVIMNVPAFFYIYFPIKDISLVIFNYEDYTQGLVSGIYDPSLLLIDSYFPSIF